MNNIKRFSSRKEVTEFLKEKEIDTSNWSEEKWLSLNKGQAEIHMMALAESIYDAMNESTPKQLKAGDWHIPFEDKIQIAEDIGTKEQVYETKVKISTAMAARTSYTIVGDEKEIDYQKMVDLHDRLLSQDPPHSSPFEHTTRAMNNEEYYTFVKGRIIEENKQEDGTCDSISWMEASGWCNNLKGFIPYRYFIDNKIEI